ncbi:MAG: potassium-transporting ATPase subunit KdpC [Deltaproteobacteria bacterium]|nr:potassium-transporting ATPase subunit KdpC [Deltaproteobacteria bacterium]MBF0524488.1 potassium-transporting ATPase subunit KdpC [Deltaproteobacteria bacterium]
MTRELLNLTKTAVLLLVGLTMVTGIIYPALVTGLAQICFPRQAGGSMIVRQGKIVGSELIGQPFDQSKYFWGRPSATSPSPYNAASSSGSNLGPTNPALLDGIKAGVAAIRKEDPTQTQPVPVDLVTASGSGLDPHISPASAMLQAQRVAHQRRLPEKQVQELILRHVEGRQLGILGEPRVNVLKLNLDLDAMTAYQGR